MPLLPVRRQMGKRSPSEFRHNRKTLGSQLLQSLEFA